MPCECEVVGFIERIEESVRWREDGDGAEFGFEGDGAEANFGGFGGVGRRGC